MLQTPQDVGAVVSAAGGGGVEQDRFVDRFRERGDRRRPPSVSPPVAAAQLPVGRVLDGLEVPERGPEPGRRVVPDPLAGGLLHGQREHVTALPQARGPGLPLEGHLVRPDQAGHDQRGPAAPDALDDRTEVGGAKRGEHVANHLPADRLDGPHRGQVSTVRPAVVVADQVPVPAAGAFHHPSGYRPDLVERPLAPAQYVAADRPALV